MIAETGTYQCGPYTVRIAVRPDNPYFPQYLVFHGEQFIGKHFSRPDEACCAWLAQQRIREGYAEPSPERKQNMRQAALRGGQSYSRSYQRAKGEGE